jgi:hypothetical protein
MPATRKLPEAPELERLVVQEGLTNQQIGDMFRVSREAVRQALAVAQIERPGAEAKVSHQHYVPWRVRADHTSDVLVRRLRSYSKLKQGKPLTATERRLLDLFMDFMDGNNPDGVPQSVHYNKDEGGFWVEPRQKGDRDYIHPPAA